MAADMWKLVDMYGRVYYYEDEKKFNRRHMAVKVERHFRDIWDKQRGNPAPSWLQEIKGYRIINDAWVEQEVDMEAYRKAVERREVRELQAAMKMKLR